MTPALVTVIDELDPAVLTVASISIRPPADIKINEPVAPVVVDPRAEIAPSAISVTGELICAVLMPAESRKSPDRMNTGEPEPAVLIGAWELK